MVLGAHERLSFKEYIQLSDSDAVKMFRKLFRDELDKLPDKTTSSKQIRGILCVDSEAKDAVFQRAFMEYFKMKLKV